VIEVRWRQRSFAEGFLREAVDEFWDDWMRAVDLAIPRFVDEHRQGYLSRARWASSARTSSRTATGGLK
jgi:hypothetical protein